MRRKIHSITAAPALLAVCLTLPASVHAGTDALRPGEYLADGGWGVLTISVSKDRATRFSIEAVGSNGHTCSLEGEIENLQARLDVDEPDKSCVVTFTPNREGIGVASVDPDLCRYFCGMRAGFEGEYLRPGPGCDSRERSAAREQFKQLYAAKSYTRALAVLEPLLSNCSRVMDWVEEGWVRNDLAVTQYHLGRLADCRKMLEPLMEDAARTDEELRESYPPADLDSYLPIAKATRYNAKLCAPEKR